MVSAPVVPVPVFEPVVSLVLAVVGPAESVVEVEGPPTVFVAAADVVAVAVSPVTADVSPLVEGPVVPVTPPEVFVVPELSLLQAASRMGATPNTSRFIDILIVPQRKLFPIGALGI